MLNLVDMKIGGNDLGVTEYERGRPYIEVLGDGVYRKYRGSAYLVTERVEKFEHKYSLPMVKKGTGKDLTMDYALPEKVPFSILYKILNFYKRVYELNKTEASAHIFYLDNAEGSRETFLSEFRETLTEEYKTAFDNGIYQEGNFVVYAPKQRNTSVVTEFGDDYIYKRFMNESGIVPVVETHSHHTMDAFWSGTDIRNQNDDFYYLVIGKIGTQDSMLLKWVHGGVEYDIPVSVAFEMPMYEVKTVVTTTTSMLVPDSLDMSVLTETTNIDLDVPHEDAEVVLQEYKGVYAYDKDGFPQTWLSNILKPIVTRPVERKGYGRPRPKPLRDNYSTFQTATEEDSMFGGLFRESTSHDTELDDLTDLDIDLSSIESMDHLGTTNMDYVDVEEEDIHPNKHKKPKKTVGSVFKMPEKNKKRKKKIKGS